MSSGSDLLLFLGRFHPVLVHLPIGLLLVLAFLEITASAQRFRNANASAGFILALAVPASIGAAVCGWLMSRGGGYDEKLLQWHLYTGFGTAVFCLIAALFHWSGQKPAYQVTLFFGVVVMAVASHFGGSLTHGSDYLTRYAPEPLRRLLGPPAAPPGPMESTGTGQSSEGTVYATVIHPIFDQYCIACHGPEKSKGRLRMDTFAALMKGGEQGAIVVPGKSSESELLKRLLLPLDSDDHMPPDGKPQPTPDDLALLKWWIDSGAPETGNPQDLKPTARVSEILSQRTGKGSSEVATKAPVQKSLVEVLPIAQQLAADLGVPITQLSEQDSWLQCNASVAGESFTDEQLAKLRSLGENLRWLDLGGTAVTDAGLTNLAAMPHLERLHLERTKVTDEGLRSLATLSQLHYLNLYGTKVTDAGLQHLEDLRNLRQVYLWQTQVTPAAAKAFQTSLIDQDQLRAWEQQIETLQSKIRGSKVSVELGVDTSPPSQAQKAKPENTECPVSGKPVNPEKTVNYEGRLVAFCCDDCKAKFQQDPKAYLVKLGARPSEDKQAAVNKECPVSGKPVDPAHSLVYEGRTIAFCCGDCLAKFKADPGPFQEKLKAILVSPK